MTRSHCSNVLTACPKHLRGDMVNHYHRHTALQGTLVALLREAAEQAGALGTVLSLLVLTEGKGDAVDNHKLDLRNSGRHITLNVLTSQHHNLSTKIKWQDGALALGWVAKNAPSCAITAKSSVWSCVRNMCMPLSNVIVDTFAASTTFLSAMSCLLCSPAASSCDRSPC